MKKKRTHWYMMVNRATGEWGVSLTGTKADVQRVFDHLTPMEQKLYEVIKVVRS